MIDSVARRTAQFVARFASYQTPTSRQAGALSAVRHRFPAGPRGLVLVLALAGACGTNNLDETADDQTGVPAASDDQLISQVQSALDAAPAPNAATLAQLTRVRPVLKCVEKISANSYSAHFGYVNTASSSISIPVGFFNRFWPSPISGGQPTVFAPGTQPDVVRVTFPRTGAVAWILGIHFDIATARSRACAPGGTGGAGGGAGGSPGTGGVVGTGGAAGVGGTGGQNHCPSNCDDHDPCTVDLCNPTTGFVCSNVPARDGTICSDGNACTIADICQAGVCVPGTSIVCQPLDQCHVPGICNQATGICSMPQAADGIACSDGNACTNGDTCAAGLCRSGTPTVCSSPDRCHAVGTCDPASGICTNAAVANGTSCADNTACNGAETCQAGVCSAGQPLQCGSANPCQVGSCDPVAGCLTANVANGTVCTSPGACGVGVCQTGTCVSTAATCDDHNPCTADACGPGGACTHAPVANGSSCGNGNACDGAESCQAGACQPGTPVTCVASDQCHVVGVCNPATGVCTNPAKADGTACTDSNACTTADVCRAGACTAGAPAQCNGPSDQCHGLGSCDPATGQCSNPSLADFTPCDDGNACTTGDSCRAGACGSGTPRICTALDQCHNAGVCTPATGACSNPPQPAGSTCGGSNVCDGSGSCVQCLTAFACPGSDSACGSRTCTAGLCGMAFASAGTGCGTGLACDGNGACVGIPTVDLSRYARVGRYNLPEPTRTAPPDGTSLLAQEASGVTYDWDTNTLFVVGDGGTSVVQVTRTGTLIDSMTLAPGGSPQGTDFYDTEGISYVGGGKFVLIEERDRQVSLFTYVAGATLHRADVQTVKLGTTIGNIGIEGLTYDPLTGHYIFVKEKEPRSIFETGIDFAAGTATNGSPTTDESTDLFAPSLVSTLDFSDIYALSNLPSLAGGLTYDQLLIISQESGKIVQVDRAGNVKHTLTIVADPGDIISVPDMTMEGITMDRDRILYVVNENGGGDVNHPQLWVYAPSTAANLAPTAVSLTGAVTSLPENTNTTSAVKLADIFVADDGLGDNNLSVSGADAGSFQIIGTALFLKAGTALNAAIQSSYHVTINVDDTTVGGAPDASTSLTLAITPASSGATNLAITEVAAWSSGSSPLASDWVEVTNFGTSSVGLVGWTMDDNSNSFAVSVPLNGVTSINPGESVIFIETASSSDLAAKAQTFINLWFGGTAPAGLQIGSYSGSGVGLSTGGDGVNLFDIGGTLRAAISFGVSPSGTPLATFDNSAGLNNVVISNLSVVGQNGAFVAANDPTEIGSPGTIGAGATPIVGITAVDGLASETGSDPGLFRFTRSGSTTSPLTVIYTIATGAGQATPGDYTPTLTGSQVIPAGAASVDVTITPVDDAIVEGPEQLTLTLTDTGSYDVGPAASATVTIQDNDSANQAPTAVTLLNTVPAISEAADVSVHVRLADISVTDDGQGTNNLSLSGTDAASFEIVGASLYLRAGTPLSHASKPTLGVTVAVDDPTVGGAPDATTGFTLTVTAAVAPGTVVISEIAPWSSANSPLAADWFEVTNTGTSAVDLTGWKMDDNSHSIANAIALNGITSIAPGEAVIFIETADLPTATAAFRSLWFGANPQRVTQIGSYSGSGVGLSSNGDEVTLFDGAGNLVTGVGFGAAPSAAPFPTFDNHAGAGSNTLPLPVISTLSAVAVNGAFIAAGDASEIGSPGIGNIGRLIITEVAPWASSNSPYLADWFEVTNVGGAVVDLTGWKMDDNSNTFASSVPIVGVGSIAPGRSAVLIEGTATTASNFVAAWFGATPPLGFLIGSYTGSGVGLGTAGDAVNLFNPSGIRITGVQFGAATTGLTFDNTAGLATVTTLSVAGVNGALLAPDGIETGSPGTTH